MDIEQSESRYEQREGRDDRDDSPSRGKDRKKSSRGERERSRRTGGDEASKERRKDDRDDREKDRSREKNREKEREREKDRKDRDKERVKEKNKERDREREKEKEKEKDRDRARDKHKERDRGKEKSKDKEREADQDTKKERDVKRDESEQTSDGLANNKAPVSTLELEDRILKMKEERSKKKNEDGSDMLSWVNKIRKIESKKIVEKQKARQMSKHLEEQDNIVQEESDDEETSIHHNLAGVKVLHGIDKVIEGGAVVLTLKDQNILADGDLNEDVDMLENVEIGEQKRRDDAYKAAKKKAGTYDDKFNDDPNIEKRMLPQYDEPDKDEGITLDDKGRIAVEAEKRLEEIRRRLNGAASNSRLEDLNVPGRVSSDYFTPEEMAKFKKPKKKKALRKRDKLDIDALEAEAVSSGLGVGDLGSRNDAKRQALKEEQDKAEAEKRDKAYQTAYAKADEASKSLRYEQALPVKQEEEEDFYADDDEDLYKSLARARKIALIKKEEEAPHGAEAVARLASAISTTQAENEQNPESQGNGVVLSEMEEFVWSLQLGEETQKHDAEDVFMEEDEEPKVTKEEAKDEPGGWSEVKDAEMEENPSTEQEEEVAPDEIIHEAAVGKGLSGALRLLQDRGALKETVDWGGRNMDKKKSKLVGIVGDDDDPKKKTHQTRQRDSKEFVYHERDIRIERLDEFGRILTPKEAFRILSHKFHGKGPGKMKQEKRMKQFHEELKLKQMKSSDTPSMSVERMREAQAQLKTPYLVLTGNVKPGQTSDPSSGYATVEKDLPGGLTPMLGDRKVEHFLGIKRKPEPSNLGPSKKSKP